MTDASFLRSILSPEQVSTTDADRDHYRTDWGTSPAAATPPDIVVWRRVNMPDNDGKFAVDAPTFKRYFAGLGFVS